jgi:hypothetical protein
LLSAKQAPLFKMGVFELRKGLFKLKSLKIVEILKYLKIN